MVGPQAGPTEECWTRDMLVVCGVRMWTPPPPRLCWHSGRDAITSYCRCAEGVREPPSPLVFACTLEGTQSPDTVGDVCA